MKRVLALILVSATSAMAQVAWSIHRTSSTQTPSPFPILDRICCSNSDWQKIETARGTYSWTGLDAYVTSEASRPGSILAYTDRFVPTWASGTNNTSAPSDLHTSAACLGSLSGTTTTDCQYKEFVTTLMQHICGVSSQPVSPLTGTCTVRVQESWNEMNVGNYWTGTVGDLAQMAEDKAAIVRAYCGDCIILGGSVSAGGDGTGGSWINGTVGLEPFLAAWGAISGAHLPDAISWHAYPARTTIKPAPMPETLAANGSATCTGTSNTSCRTAIKDQVSTLYSSSILCNAAITSWACNLPIWQTEGGFGLNSAMTDGVSGSDSNTWLLRRAYASRWMIALAAIPASGVPPAQSIWYSWQDQCWGTSNGTNAADSSCSGDPLIPSGPTNTNTAFVQTKNWLANSQYVGPLNSTAVSGGNVWTVTTIYKGYPAQIVWFDGWLSTTTLATTFPRSQTLLNSNSVVVKSMTLGNEPVLLTRTNATTFSIF